MMIRTNQAKCEKKEIRKTGGVSAMKRFRLGKTGIEVTELCFGALPMGPLQKNMDEDEAASIVARTLSGGVNFIDTAQVYATYGPIKKALEITGMRPVIASKCNASEYGKMEEAVHEALELMGIDYIDIFHLHAARGDKNLFRSRAGALKALCDLKEKGIVRAVGASGHSTEMISAAADVEELDVVFPLVNYKGMGIIEGTLDDMLRSIEKCDRAGKGLYFMKVLAGGNLAEEYGKALAWARSLGDYPIALGMVSEKEVDYNLAYFNSDKPESIPDPTFSDFKKRFNVVRLVCTGCGSCIETCASQAIVFSEGKAFIQLEKCVMCGYCVGVCPVVAIRPL